MPKIFLFFFLASGLFACNSPFVTKPTGFFNVPFPEHQYRSFNQEGYPYSFEYPVYTNIIKDTSFFETAPENPWWINIDFPRFNGRMYVSYKDLGKNDFSKMVNDAFKLTYKHTTKATGINDSLVSTPNGIHGVFFTVQGNAATASQFFLSDSVKHFIRGAFYFYTTPNEDSLAPMNIFIRKDMEHLINTFKWR